MHQQLLTMLSLQDSMNSKVHPEWRAEHFEWYRAIWIESAELMDHFGWKWWKKQKVDRDQVILELIDIWHFGLSDLLQKEASHARIAEELGGALHASPMPGNFLEDVERFAGQVLTTRAFDAEGFVRMMAGAGLSFTQLFKAYVGKNVLNIFRQDHGYKSGSYIKIWAQREDNEHLVEVLESADVDSQSFKEEVYAGLKQRYPAEL